MFALPSILMERSPFQISELLSTWQISVCATCRQLMKHTLRSTFGFTFARHASERSSERVVYIRRVNIRHMHRSLATKGTIIKRRIRHMIRTFQPARWSFKNYLLCMLQAWIITLPVYHGTRRLYFMFGNGEINDVQLELKICTNRKFWDAAEKGQQENR